MSQNRQEDRDRMRAQGDYLINLKAELEVMFLNEKLTTTFYTLNEQIMKTQELLSQLVPRAPEEPKK
jgi:uncharacterized membrane protein